MKTPHSNHSPSAHLSRRVLAARHAGPFSLLLLSGILSFGLTAAESKRVALVRTPDGGIQPQAAVDSQGAVHLIYYKGDAGGGDIFYVRQEPGQKGFSNPLQVNSQPGSAMSAGTIRGAQLALGKNGRVHVAWNGGKGATGPTINGEAVTPLLYTRWNDAGTGFEAERNLITYAAGLDGGSSVAADGQGNVYVAWHASRPGNTNGEAGRAVFVAGSRDEGKTFQRETPAISKPTGACGCCGMRAFADTAGAVYILYRAASEMVNRAEILLVSPRPGAEFQIANSHPWTVASCPMSSATLTEGKQGVLAAWETAGQVYYAVANPKTLQVSKPVAPPGSARRKHPVAVANGKGETLFAWTEGIGWAKGGAVAWQLYDKDGNATSEKGRADGVPVWSLATAFAKPDGRFIIVY
ncbi:MAG: sialidase family protein [Verrucomicrobiota bacterium]